MIAIARRFAFAIAVCLLVGVIGVVAAFLLAVALPDLQSDAAAPPAARATPTPGASGATSMTWLPLPQNADCSACHSTDTGIGVREIPKLGHPLEGWSTCTECHADDRLVKTAPGHTGIHANECLLCHKQTDTAVLAPLSRPHRDLQNQACLSCHGSTAPLPSDMSHRTQTVCWLCHRLPQIEPPLPNHTVTAGEKDCLSCHVAAKDGALPADHATRTDAECLLCHEPREMAPTFPPTPTPMPPGQVSYAPEIPLLRLNTR